MGLLAKFTGRSRCHDRSTEERKVSATYRAVEVVPAEEGCCQAARNLAGRRFLSHEVPRLPLEQCDAANCRCSYQLFDDRREEARRASDIGFDMASELRTAENKRSGEGGRREQDR